MRASRTRELSVGDALDLLKRELGRCGLTAATRREGGDRAAVVQCQLRDSRGRMAVDTGGYGEGLQAEASAMFEAWQWFWHIKGFTSYRYDAERMSILSPAEITKQHPLEPDGMIARLARDYPDSRIACLRYDPFFNADSPLWYPAFARFPWIRQHPIPGDAGYTPYLRYATAIGTATGTSQAEALLHALTEVIEGDAVSLALLDWYLNRAVAPRQVYPEDLPAELRIMFSETHGLVGSVPYVFDVSTDLQVPAFIAVPSDGGQLGVCGEGASLIPGYAMERALGELVQAYIWNRNMASHEILMRTRIENIAEWPVLRRCAEMDPRDLAERATRALPHEAGWWDTPDTDVDGQLSRLTGILSDAGYQGYRLQWNPEGRVAPVITVVVPGLDTFFLAHKGIPVLPSGRGMRRIGVR